MRKTLILLFVVILRGAPILRAQELAYQAGESLRYVVSYKSKVIKNLDMGEVFVTVEADTLADKPLLRVDGYARVMGAFRWFFKMDDYYYSWIDAETSRPVKARCNIREGSYLFESEYVYDWDAMQSHNSWKRPKWENRKTKTIDLTDDSMDGVSLYYDLRTTDFSDYAVGDERVLNLLLEDTIRHVKYVYFGADTVNVRGLGVVPSIKFSCQLATSQGESFEDGSVFFIWISDDPNKIPVFLESPIRVGSIRARLTDYSGLKYPEDSVLK